MIVHLNGWPGAGKKTIGALVANERQYRFIHNHLLHDIAIVCAGLRGEGRWPLYETVRKAAYKALKDLSCSEGFVMTNAMCKERQRELDAWKHVVELAIDRQSSLVPIVLTLAIEENCRRIQSNDRKTEKLSDPDRLREMVSADTIQVPDVPECLILDVTNLTADKACQEICRHLSSLGPKIHPATEKHLRLR